MMKAMLLCIKTDAFDVRKLCFYNRLFIISVHGIISGIVQSAALLALQSPSGYKIAHVNHVTEFADIAGGTDALE